VAVRMKDIARDLGVSLMTVSKALRNHSDISAHTRDRVLKRMRELNYQPDWIRAQHGPRGGPTWWVWFCRTSCTPFFAEVAKGHRPANSSRFGYQGRDR